MTDDKFYCSFLSIHYIICECGKIFPSEDDLKTHLDKEHPNKKERKEYKCGVCSQTYPTEQECIDHYEQSHIEIKLEHNYVAEIKYENEETTIEPDYTSYIDSDYIQDTCEVITEESPDLVEITLEEAGMRKCRQRSKNTKNAKNIVCELCGKRYASNAALRYHQRVHTGERPYKCTMCDRAFAMPLFLQIHTRTHTGERPYQCNLCPKAFSNKAALLRHNRVHTGVKPYKCPKCGKSFTQSNSRKLHINTVHLKMPAPYKSKSRRLKAKENADILREYVAVVKTINPALEEVKLESQTLDDVAYRLVCDEDYSGTNA